ncbi:molybdenum cofactor biosynthesis protein B [Pseudomonas sp. N040]|uniref:molybdenum cofactor biosynthesis protein B n=1 Tax=Pseudomonas sp. N040 TaxID=2785325 RepID=UPI0018A324C8|nr:molybdenum cofactor biosynthesis protein B [Pseudomonas sp. N040]MBF7731401.1 molybdenum cofactor biosynthesis protein B [Pseudomonas sp. N040]MBW7015045.1 molybdenum cofactor biosynthesis protein B [Pseudomonas sp. N040]
MGHKEDSPFVPLAIAVLTVSDTRSFETDTSGQLLVDRLSAAGHQLAARVLLKDDLYRIRAQVAGWIAEDAVQVVIITGGTGFTGRDSTPEAVACLLDKQVEGFGELFRQISVADIGTSTIQSRALAGLANGTLVCCLPGSTNACRTAWDGILAEQLDARHRPCNFVPHLKAVAACPSRG